MMIVRVSRWRPEVHTFSLILTSLQSYIAHNMHVQIQRGKAQQINTHVLSAHTSLQVDGVVHSRRQSVLVQTPQLCADGTQVTVRAEWLLAGCAGSQSNVS